MKAKPKRILFYDSDKTDYMVEMDNHWYYLVMLGAKRILVYEQPLSYVNHQPYIEVPKKTSDIPLEVRKNLLEGIKTFPYHVGLPAILDGKFNENFSNPWLAMGRKISKNYQASPSIWTNSRTSPSPKKGGSKDA